jgi:hypothetical protein
VNNDWRLIASIDDWMMMMMMKIIYDASTADLRRRRVCSSLDPPASAFGGVCVWGCGGWVPWIGWLAWGRGKVARMSSGAAAACGMADGCCVCVVRPSLAASEQKNRLRPAA